MCSLLIVAASSVAEHGVSSTGSGEEVHGRSCAGDLPGLRMSPALAGRFLITRPPGKSPHILFDQAIAMIGPQSSETVM